MFLVNDTPALLLFDSGAAWLIVSLAFSKKFDVTQGVLSHSLVMEIVDDHTVCASRFYHDCVLEMFRVRFPVNLVHVPLKGTRIIMGMDWLSRNGHIIDYERQLVRVRTPNVFLQEYLGLPPER